MDLNDAGPQLEQQLWAAGLDPDRLEPWPAWKAFKAWARTPVVGAEGSALYVQLGPSEPADEFRHVTFIRQLALADLDPEGEGALLPVREIVCDLGYDPVSGLLETEVELRSTDFGDLESFFAAVEGRDDFQHALSVEPAGSLVSWQEL